MTTSIPSHVSSVIDESGAVLLDLRRGKYFSLSKMGVEIWQRLEAGLPLSEVEDEIIATFDAAADVIRHDVKEFVQKLRDAELINTSE